MLYRLVIVMPTKKQHEEQLAELETDAAFHKLSNDINKSGADAAKFLYQHEADKNKQLEVEKELAIICADIFQKKSKAQSDGKNAKCDKATEAMFDYYKQGRHNNLGKQKACAFAGQQAITFGKLNREKISQESVHRRFVKLYGKDYDKLVK